MISKKGKKKRDLGGYKSGFEKKIADALLLAGHQANYETQKLRYTVPEKEHTYTPDFILSNGIIVEAKGRLTYTDRVKMKWVKKSNPALDIRFVFMKQTNTINKGSKTTYAGWAEKNGFKYAEKTIPEAWQNEKG